MPVLPARFAPAGGCGDNGALCHGFQTMTSSSAVLPADALAGLADADTQRRAALLVQDAFAQVFRLTVDGDDAAAGEGVAQLGNALGNWSAAADDGDGRVLRLALLLSGLDQWGLAYCQAFGLQGLPALSALLGTLRGGLDATDDSRLQRHYASIGAAEGNAIDFKVDVRRAIHLALWHGAVASEERDEALRLAAQLGGMLVALTREMPELGWRLVADALAHIQIQCLAHGLAAEGLAREATEALFAALARELPASCRDEVMATSARVVMSWQQARRPH